MRLIVPCVLAYHPNGNLVSGIGTGEAVLDVQVATLQVGQELPIKRVETGRVERPIHRPPPDLILG